MANTANIRLSIINSMLRTIGSSPLAGEDTHHPDFITANAVLAEVLEDFSSKPLWFNNSKETLTQTTDGRVAIPSNAVAIDPVDGSDYVARDRFLWDVNGRTYEINKDVECYIHRELELGDMPREAIKYIRACARYKFYLDEDGGAQKLRGYGIAMQEAENMLNIVNIARMDINFFRSAGAANFYNPRPSNYQHIGGSYGSSSSRYNSFTRN